MGIRKDIFVFVAAGSYVGTSLQADYMDKIVHDYKMSQQGFTDLDEGDENVQEIWKILGDGEKAPSVCFFREYPTEAWVYTTESCKDIDSITFIENDQEILKLNKSDLFTEDSDLNLLVSEISKILEDEQSS